MGYTHYFPQSEAFTTPEWDIIMTAAKAIIAAQPKGLICGPDGTGDPIVNEKQIALNGSEIDDQGHESFIITKAKYPDFNFCKTAEKPYDVVVVAILCIVEHFAPGKLKISSDGNRADWQKGLNLAQQNGFSSAKIPRRVRK